jgi:outer membrane lipoprotein carrier protein
VDRAPCSSPWPRRRPGPAPRRRAGQPAAAAAVIEKMQKNYDQARTSAPTSRRSTPTSPSTATKVSSGEVAFKKGGRMRWDYDKPDPQMFVSDGRSAGCTSPATSRPSARDLKQSQLPARWPSSGQGQADRRVRDRPGRRDRLRHKADYRLSLKPKQPQSTYKAIYFIVDAKTFYVTESVLVNAQGDINDITFADVKVNTKIADTALQVDAPAPTCKVIDTASWASSRAGSPV